MIANKSEDIIGDSRSIYDMLSLMARKVPEGL